MADDFSTSFSFDLDSNMPQVAADSAESVYALQEAIKAGSDELRGMQQVLRAFKGTAGANSETVKALSDRISAQKAVVATSAQNFAKLGATYGKVKNPADQLKASQEASVKQFLAQASALARAKNKWHEGYTSIEQYRSAMLRAGKAAEQLRLDKAARGLSMVKAGAVALVAAYAGVAAAALMAAAAVAKFGLAAANARRSELLHLEGLSKLRYGYYAMFGAIGPAADKASFLQSTIDQVSDSVALGRDRIMGYTEQLYKMGLRSGNLQAALEGVTTVASVQGDEAAQAWLGMAYGSALTGKNVRALADDVKARLGPIAAAQMLDWNVQSAKLKEKFDRLFSGIKLEPLLKGLNKITQMFSISRAEGAALKQLIEVVFQPLSEFVGGPGGLLVKRFIQGLIIGTQALILVVLKVRGAFLKAFGNTDLIKNADLMHGAVLLGVAAVGGLTAVLVALISPFVLVGALAYVAYTNFTLFADGIHAVIDAAKQLISPAKGSGMNIVQGLADGILGGQSLVTSAMLKIGKAALGAFKGQNEIHSPSALYRKTALAIPQGKALGIEDGEPLVKKAMLKLKPESAGEVRAQAGASGAQAGAGGDRPNVFQFGDLVLPAGSSREQTADFLRQLEQALAGVNIQMGTKNV